MVEGALHFGRGHRRLDDRQGSGQQWSIRGGLKAWSSSGGSSQSCRVACDAWNRLYARYFRARIRPDLGDAVGRRPNLRTRSAGSAGG